MSVRLAMGAGQRRILRQMMTESLLLSFLGGASDCCWRGWCATPFHACSRTPGIPGIFSAVELAYLRVCCRSLGFDGNRLRAGACVEIDAGRSEFKPERERANCDAPSSSLGGKAIVAVQVALSMLLVIGAGLFVRTLMQLGRLRWDSDRIICCCSAWIFPRRAIRWRRALQSCSGSTKIRFRSRSAGRGAD